MAPRKKPKDLLELSFESVKSGIGRYVEQHMKHIELPTQSGYDFDQKIQKFKDKEIFIKQPKLKVKKITIMISIDKSQIFSFLFFFSVYFLGLREKRDNTITLSYYEGYFLNHLLIVLINILRSA